MPDAEELGGAQAAGEVWADPSKPARAVARGAVGRPAPGKAAWSHATCSGENEVAIVSTCITTKSSW